jgi:hypothetical protein
VETVDDLKGEIGPCKVPPLEAEKVDDVLVDVRRDGLLLDLTESGGECSRQVASRPWILQSTDGVPEDDWIADSREIEGQKLDPSFSMTSMPSRTLNACETHAKRPCVV